MSPNTTPNAANNSAALTGCAETAGVDVAATAWDIRWLRSGSAKTAWAYLLSTRQLTHGSRRWHKNLTVSAAGTTLIGDRRRQLTDLVNYDSLALLQDKRAAMLRAGQMHILPVRRSNHVFELACVCRQHLSKMWITKGCEDAWA